MCSSYAIAILAGGEGRRFGGIPKGKIKLNRICLLDRLLKISSEIRCPRILVVKNKTTYKQWKIPQYEDLFSGHSPMIGIFTALSVLNVDFVLILAVDLVGLTTDLLRFMLAQREHAEVIIPRIRGRFEPLCAVYDRKLKDRFLNLIESGHKKPIEIMRYSTSHVLDEVQFRRFGDPEKLFTNLNSIQEFENSAYSEYLIELPERA